MHFFYDAQGRPAMVDFNGQRFTYLYNLQGDIVGILDANGTFVVKYKYDAWGRKLPITGSLAATLDVLNPFRYRGYVYDEETGLYYLRSRYYSAERCRFVNTDVKTIPGLLTLNAFAYCSNGPVGKADPDGCDWRSWLSDKWNSVTAFVRECFQAQVRADIISAQQRARAVNKLVNGAKELGQGVSDWWKNKAAPWINQAKVGVGNALNRIGKAMRDALHAQQQADILSAQMTYNTACNIGNWLMDNWKDIVDWAGITYTGGVFLGKHLVKVGVITVAPWVGAAMIVADVGFWVYAIGDKMEWW